MFWPEDEPSAARRRLNQLLYSIKKRFGEPFPFHLDGEDIRQAPAGVTTDLQEFSRALREHRLSEALALISGRFLKNCEGLFTTEFSDWIEFRDRSLRGELRKEARARFSHSEDRGDWESSHISAEVLLSLDPVNEDLLRLLLQALARVGNFSDIEPLIQEYSSRIQHTLGSPWTPSPETRTLLEKIRSEEEAPGPIWTLRSSPERRDPPLLGREKEHKLLRRTLSTLPHQALRGILVTGEAGIGKTRLIKESLSGMAFGGQSIFTAGTAELERLIPLNPLIEAFATSHAGKVLARLEDPWRAVLYGVMPRHFPDSGPIPQAPQIQPGSVPRRLFEAFYQLLLSMAEEEPVILVIEDIQWADQTTLAVLDFLVRRWDQGRLQILVSARSEEINRNETLKSFLEMLRVHEDFLEVSLGDLTATASSALIRGLSERHLLDEEVRHLQVLAGGNPFFLIELTLEYLAGRVDQPMASSSALTIPLSIRQVLQRRLSHLSPDADQLLGALSVHMKPLSFQNLACLVGAPTQDCITALDQLHHFRLIHGSGIQVSIGHELIRQTVYQGLSASRRAWLHERVARHLQESPDPPPSDELAVHFHAAGLGEEAKEHSRCAADHAEESGAVAEALRFLEIAREHSEDPEEIAELIERMGHLNYLHQNLEEAAPLLEIAAQRFRRQGHNAKALVSELERIDALGQSGLLPLRECLEELGEVKKEAKELGEWGTYTRALDVEVHFLHHSGDLEGVQGVIREAAQISDLGQAEARCRARAILALNLYFGDPEVGISAAREAVSIAMETTDRDLQLHALNRLVVVLLYQGRLGSEEGQEVQEAAEVRCASSGDLILKFFTRLNRAVWSLEAGELEKARNAFPVAESVLKTTQAKDAHLWLHLNRGELEYALDDVPAARVCFSQASDLIRKTSPTVFRTVVAAGLGLCAIHEGNLSEAKQLESELPELPSHWTFDPSVIALFKAEMLRMRGDVYTAERFLHTVAEDVRSRFVTSWVKLSIRRIDFLLRSNPEEAEKVAREVHDLTLKLELKERSRELERKIPDLGSS